MDFIRDHKKISICILAIAVLILLFGTTFARYIYNIVHNHILESNEFYFNSSVLAMNGKQYKINNWDGVNNQILTVDVNNKKNTLHCMTVFCFIFYVIVRRGCLIFYAVIEGEIGLFLRKIL